MLAAALLVLTIAIKPYGVLLLPGLAGSTPHAATAVAAAIGVWLLLLLPVPLYGVAGTIDLHWRWWQTVTETHAAQPVESRQRLARVDVRQVAGAWARSL